MLLMKILFYKYKATQFICVGMLFHSVRNDSIKAESSHSLLLDILYG